LIAEEIVVLLGLNISASILAQTLTTTRKPPLLELKVFQSQSAKVIADRYAFFANHPDRPRKGNKPRPFFQALSALTGAGKTPILAQAVALMRAHFGTEPIVLWMFKAKSVVAETYTNFSAGKYSEIVEGFLVINIQGLNPQLISDGATPLLIMTTTGLFNNKDQSEGALNIYDKSMGSSIQVEQIIGRVLRQYGATHYDNPLLNSAHFFFAWTNRASSPKQFKR
jgi:hypothetical protein